MSDNNGSTHKDTPQDITEEMGVHKDWYKVAANAKNNVDLVNLMDHVLKDYHHDYGTIAHAMAACAIAAVHVANHYPAGGITGFQASCVMWEFIKNWMHFDSPLRLVKYDYMLYPQYSEKFEKTIDKSTFEWLQKEAKKHLIDAAEKKEKLDPEVFAHWQSIVDGVVPFGYSVEEND